MVDRDIYRRSMRKHRFRTSSPVHAAQQRSLRIVYLLKIESLIAGKIFERTGRNPATALDRMFDIDFCFVPWAAGSRAGDNVSVADDFQAVIRQLALYPGVNLQCSFPPAMTALRPRPLRVR